MVVVQSYVLAVFLCFVTMLCWGSWANTQKLASKEWRFQLFYWDYAIGVFLFTLAFAGTFGSIGSVGRSFVLDLGQASTAALGLAFLGGVVFNLANILLVAGIDIAGMAVAFPVGIGLAMVEGVLINYIFTPVGNRLLLFLGVAGVVLAMIMSALAYSRIPSQGQKTIGKGLLLSIVAGILMGIFFFLVAASMARSLPDGNLEAGRLSPYTALVLFSAGLLLSNFVLNSLIMVRPFVGDPVPFGDYFTKGNLRLHLIGILGGVIWSIGMSLSILASSAAGFAISYGLGQGATMIAAFWGVFIWKEFRAAPAGTSLLLTLMFVFFIVGLGLIVVARIA